MKSDAFSFDLRSVDWAGRDGHAMAARLESERNGHVGVNIAERSKRSDQELFGRQPTYRPPTRGSCPAGPVGGPSSGLPWGPARDRTRRPTGIRGAPSHLRP